MGPTECKHQVLIDGGITENYRRCYICGAIVPYSYCNLQNTSYSSQYVLTQHCENNNIEYKKSVWSPPPGAPKKRKLFQ